VDLHPYTIDVLSERLGLDGNHRLDGLLRQYLPKGSDLSAFSQHQLNAIARRLNTRPRKCLDFATPLEVFQQLHHHPSVALGS